MQGIGEQLTQLPDLPELSLVLINPGVSVPTPQIFKTLTTKNNAPMGWPMESENWLDWLRAQRNDLEPPAIAAAPVIRDVLEALAAQRGCHLARMSGSGATCFGIFSNATTQAAALAHIKTAHPEWWAVTCKSLPSGL